jgi:prepilin-type N-terminal cleavage/methylation domain-containing protein
MILFKDSCRAGFWRKMMRHSAFTIIELLLVITIIGILATMTLPRIIRKSPDSSWEHITFEINNLAKFARQESIAQQKTYRISFISGLKEKDLIRVEVETDDPEKPGTTIFKETTSEYFTPRYELPEHVYLNQVYKGKEEALKGRRIKRASCHVIPHGLVEEVTVHLSREEEKGAVSKASLHMAPFLGRFVMEQGHIKPHQRKNNNEIE